MKRVTVNINIAFEVPDNTNVEILTVEFPNGLPVVALPSGPVADGKYICHTTDHSFGDED